ncbi:MAG: hypothetical protein HUJ61_06635 [Bacilli bacterium]|nr:hypothetical protein [Bacilli bacterium]
MKYDWEHYASLAKTIAKRIVTGEEINQDGVRLVQIVYKQDMYATDALNMRYRKYGSKASVHTYNGGQQEISTEHADGTNGLFKSNGQYHSTQNIMDNEIKNYMNKNLDESTKMLKKVIITESDLFKIVKECIMEAHGANSYDWAYYNALGFNDGHLSPDMKNIEQRYSYIINKERPNLASNRKRIIDAISTDIEDTNKIHNDRLNRNSKSLDPLRVKELRKNIGYSPSSVKFPNDFIVTYDGGYNGLDESIRRAIREVLR